MTNPIDVFISYAREDKPVATQLAEALEARGLNVWWDVDLIAGTQYHRTLLAKIDEARRVIVLWSPDAVGSDFVLDEASRAHQQGKLLPVSLDGTPPALGFGALHTLFMSSDALDIDAIASALNVTAPAPDNAVPQGPQAPSDPEAPRDAPPPPRPWWRSTGAYQLAFAALVIGIVVAVRLNAPSQEPDIKADSNSVTSDSPRAEPEVLNLNEITNAPPEITNTPPEATNRGNPAPAGGNPPPKNAENRIFTDIGQGGSVTGIGQTANGSNDEGNKGAVAGEVDRGGVAGEVDRGGVAGEVDMGGVAGEADWGGVGQDAPKTNLVYDGPPIELTSQYFNTFSAYLTGWGMRRVSAGDLLTLGPEHNDPNSPCYQMNHVPPQQLWPNILPLARLVEELRKQNKGTIEIVEAFRSKAYNDCANRDPHSFHRSFAALDLRARDMNTTELARLIESLPSARDVPGIDIQDSFVHLDMRPWRLDTY